MIFSPTFFLARYPAPVTYHMMYYNCMWCNFDVLYPYST